MIKVDLTIIGAGPAGIFTAINAVQNNKNILILEKNSTAGKKLLITGSGKCNITHSGDIRDFFNHYGKNNKFLMSALYSFDNSRLLSYFNQHKLKFITNEQGKIFPESDKAADILEALLAECKVKKIKFNFNSAVEQVNYDKKKRVFIIETAENIYKSNYLVLATGGKSYPKTGSTGDGYEFARQLGHKIITPQPALTSLINKNKHLINLAGISLKNVEISLWRNNNFLQKWQDDILFTHQGLSGPAIINYSRYFKIGDQLKLNLVDFKNKTDFENDLLKKSQQYGSLNLKNLLKKYQLATRIITEILPMAQLNINKNSAHLSKMEAHKIAQLFCEFKVDISHLAGFNKAMITAGGIDLTEIDPGTMESKLCNKLFAVGEILNIDGDTGGYNLQAAFSTAYLAGQKLKDYFSNN